jgi:hypothetical protein
MLDIIQSYFIKGAIIFVIVQAMISLQQTLYERSLKSQLEQEMFQMSAILSSDLRLVGSDTTTAFTSGVLFFISADTNLLQFTICDSSSLTVSHTIKYSVTKPSNYYELDRSVDGGSVLPVGRNLTRFQCLFIDSVGNTLTPTPLSSTNRKKIKSITVLAKMQTTTLTKDTVSSIWQAKIYPQNLQ